VVSRGPVGYRETDSNLRFFTAARRSPPYRYRDSRNANRRADFATRERESRGRIVAPFRQDRAQPDIGTPGTRRSGEHAQPPRCRGSSAGRVRISSNRVFGLVRHAAARSAYPRRQDRRAATVFRRVIASRGHRGWIGATNRLPIPAMIGRVPGPPQMATPLYMFAP
jgi:hypothetical protein